MGDKQSILHLYSKSSKLGWWWLQKNSKCNIGSHFKPYRWDTRRGITREELVNDHDWIPIAGHGLVGWEDD